MYRYLPFIFLALVSFPINSLAATAEVDDVRQIARLYSAAFDRNPKTDGLNFWVNSYNLGESVTEIARQFCQSPEFTNRYGALNDDMFVRQLLKNVLGRDGAQGAIDFWTGKLAEGSSCASILKSISDSPEHIAKTSAILDTLHYEDGFWVLGNSQGEFLAGQVEGLSYRTATLSGKTGSDGKFEYLPGESVEFLVGETSLGEAMGQAQISPFDLAGSAVLTGINIAWAIEDDDDPYQAVINKIVLLQSLDDDADPVNGILITPAVAALFRGLSLDMRQPWQDFQNAPTLHHALGLARSQGLFAVAHGVAGPTTALQYLYQTLAIDARTVGVSSLQHEESDRAPPLNYLEKYIEIFQYDANGNLTRHDDGTQEAFETWEYDANDKIIRVERDLAKYGFDVGAATRHYDANGNVTQVLIYRGPEGGADQIESYTYDPDGNLICKTVNNDEVSSECWQYKYHVNGSLMQLTEEEERNDSFETESWQYDDLGNLTRHETFWDYEPSQRQWHTIETWKYNDEGEVILETLDDDGDGNPEEIRGFQYEYDASGNLTQKKTVDNTNDALIAIEDWQYDASGHKTRYECDGACEGVDSFFPFPLIHRLDTWRYHKNGNTKVHEINQTVSIEEFSSNDFLRYQYDVDGNLTTESSSFNGSPLSERHWYYNDRGSLMRSEGPVNDFGNPEPIEIWQYDADGNLTSYERDDNGDGSIEVTETYQYEPTGWGHLFGEADVFLHGYLPPEKPGPEFRTSNLF